MTIKQLVKEMFKHKAASCFQVCVFSFFFYIYISNKKKLINQRQAWHLYPVELRDGLRIKSHKLTKKIQLLDNCNHVKVAHTDKTSRMPHELKRNNEINSPEILQNKMIGVLRRGIYQAGV